MFMRDEMSVGHGDWMGWGSSLYTMRFSAGFSYEATLHDFFDPSLAVHFSMQPGTWAKGSWKRYATFLFGRSFICYVVTATRSSRTQCKGKKIRDPACSCRAGFPEQSRLAHIESWAATDIHLMPEPLRRARSTTNLSIRASAFVVLMFASLSSGISCFLRPLAGSLIPFSRRCRFFRASLRLHAERAPSEASRRPRGRILLRSCRRPYSHDSSQRGDLS